MLKVVGSVCPEEKPDYDTVIRLASEPVAPGTTPTQIVLRAQRIADMTVELIQTEQNPALLASVCLVITDTPKRVAFLELIGEYLR